MIELSDDELLKWLKLRHDAYDDYKGSRTFLSEAYRGGEQYFNKKNFPKLSAKETEKEYAGRISLATRENFSRKLVRRSQNVLYRRSPKRLTNRMDSLMERFYENSGGKGVSINDFMRRASVLAAVEGVVHIAVVNPPGLSTENPEGLPICYLIRFEAMKKGAYDQQGNLIWCHYELDELEQVLEGGLPKNKEIHRHYIWTSASLQIIDVIENRKQKSKPEIIRHDPIPNELGGVIPITTLYANTDGEFDDETSPFVGVSDIEEVARLDRVICIYWSLLTAILHDQTYSQLTMPASSINMISELQERTQQVHRAKNVVPPLGQPTYKWGDGDVSQLYGLEQGTNRVLVYSDESSSPPRYISPDASQGQLLLESINLKTKQLLRSTGQAGEGGTETGNSRQSGVSKMWDHDTRSREFRAKARSLQTCEYRIKEFVYLWHGIPLEESQIGLIEYPQEFDTQSIEKEMQMLKSELDLELGLAYETYVKKSYISKRHPDMPMDDLEAVNTELEELLSPVGQDSVSSPNLGGSISSPTFLEDSVSTIRSHAPMRKESSSESSSSLESSVKNKKTKKVR